MRQLFLVIKGILFFDSNLHLPPRVGVHEEIRLLQGLALVTNHIDLWLYLSSIFLITPQDDCDEIRNCVSRFVRDLKALLELCGHSYMLFTHHHVVVGFSVDPPNPLQR
jgi:hypothetical protein